jgi:hypothetical protein
MYIRNCPTCNKEIKYSKKGNMNRAIAGKKVCKSCSVKLRNNDASYLNKISESRKKYFKELSKEDKETWKSNNSKAQKEAWKNKSGDDREKYAKIISDRMLERWSDTEYKERVSTSMKENTWTKNKTVEEITEINNRTTTTKYEKYGTLFPGGGNKQKKTLIEGLVCESSFELKYIESLIAKNLELPRNAERIKTPFGYYTPDFEYEDRFIEIKCGFTYNVLIGESSFSKSGKYNQSQLNKIKWVSQNIKNVEIIIMP